MTTATTATHAVREKREKYHFRNVVYTDRFSFSGFTDEEV